MSNTKYKPEEYQAIAWWGYSLGSMSYYVEAQQKLAAEQGQPLDVIYEQYDSNGRTAKWSTLSDCNWNAKEVFEGWKQGKYVQRCLLDLKDES